MPAPATRPDARPPAELVGTALLAVAVVGSGITAERPSPGGAGLPLLENALVTGAALVAVIPAVGRVSGAHRNPVVTVADRAFGGLGSREAGAYGPSSSPAPRAALSSPT